MSQASADNETLINELTTPRDLIRWGASWFAGQEMAFGHGNDNPLDEAAQLVLHALKLPQDVADIYFEVHLLPDERRRALALMQRRVEQRLPAPYVTGEAWFAGLPFNVDQRVLIPRSPIAELIEAEFEPWLEGREPESILDLCTGCGAIAIACALLFPYAEVDATDLSEDALEVARSNTRRHEVELRVNVVASDVFEALEDRRYDLIVTNPPYIGAEEMRGLDAEYRHEPQIAFAGGDDGLDLVERLLFDAPGHLNEDGLLVMEVGYTGLALERRWPDLPIEWADLERGGVGIGILEADDLAAWVAAQQ